jgi:hypothetical protein
MFVSPSCLFLKKKLLLRIKTGSVIFENHWSKVLIYLILIPTGSFFDKREPPNTWPNPSNSCPQKICPLKAKGQLNPMNFFNPKGNLRKVLGVGKDIYSIIYYIPWYHGKFKISVSNNCEDEFEDSILKDKIF